MRAFASRYDRRAGAGRNNPVRVTVEMPEGKEHDVYLKASGSPELSVSGLAAEVLAACIAGRVGLPVCRPFLVDITPEWIATVSDPEAREMLARSNRVAFGSEAAGNDWIPWIAGERLGPRLRRTAFEILAFDAFVENPDRKPSNPNLLFNGRAFRVIDHELSLKVQGIFPRPQPWRPGGMTWITGPDRHVFVGRLRRQDLDFDVVRAAWLAITDDCLSDYESAMPTELNAAAPFVEAAISHVPTVRDRIDDCLTEIGRMVG